MSGIARIRLDWLQSPSRARRSFSWLAVVVAGCAVLRLLFGKGAIGSFFGTLTTLGLLVVIPLGLFYLTRALYRRVLWKVRNRLVLTYLLMGLAPVVLFATLTAIAGYIFAGQFSISAALAGLNDATNDLKSEALDLAGVLTLPEMQHTQEAVRFDQPSNTRESDISVAVLKDGTWRTLPLATGRGSSPVSPFDGAPKPQWMQTGYHGVMVWQGKLFLCRVAGATEDGRSSQVLTAMQLNQKTLSTIGASLGRVLLFSGGAKEHRVELDNAEHEAETAEDEADLAEAQRDKRRELEETRRDAAAQLQEAQRDADRAQSQVERARERTSSKDEQDDAQEALNEAQGELRDAQHQVQDAIAPASETPTPAIPKPAAAKGHRPVEASGNAAHATATETGQSSPATPPAAGEQFTAVSGGTLPAAHLLDPRVYFTAPFPVSTWDSGQQHSAMLVVISRPSALYARLFSSSVEMGSLLRNVLVAIAIGFGFIELLALWMASRLSGTITRSVADLYQGTTEIDKGNLGFRVRPHRQDQLGALAGSFNRMAGSIQDLLVQQRERDRLLNELAIAQEVQQNLFPQSPVSISGLEMHAVCSPARSVSGDYFDFIFGHNTFVAGTGACIALGDISGKGISAALLMATLHSAVRAFSLREEADMPSPAQQLELLNKHLFGSTQANRYATLFLAFYDAQSRRLTYANGGHLPPFLISRDGTVRRLDVGGAVVGLLEDMQYEQATVEMHPGDLLAAFTDGVTEPEDGEGQEFGDAKLLHLLEEHATAPLPQIADTIFAQLNAWIAGQEQPDDMTLLLARQR